MILVDIYRRLKAATLGTWLLFFVPAFIFFAFILRIGPALQFFSSTALNNRAPSIYDAAFQNELIRFVNLAGWLRLGFHPLILAIAAGVTIATVSAKTLRGAAAMAGLATFALWTVNDAVSVFLSLEEASLLTSTSANFVGGFLVALIAFAILCLYDYLGKEALKARSVKALFPIAVISLGVLISAAAYTVLIFVYQPIPARIEAILSTPASGTFDAGPYRNPAAGDDGRQAPASGRRFRFLPRDTAAREAVVGNVLGHPHLTWRSTRNERYTVEIALFMGCSSDSDIARLQMPAARFTQQNIAGLDLDFGDGITHFHMLNSEGNRFSVDAGRFADYALEAGDGINLGSLSDFARNRANLNVKARLPFSFYVAGPLLLEPGAPGVSRTLAMRLGAAARAIRFDRAARLPARRGPRSCRAVQAGSGSSLPSRVATDRDFVGALVRISRGAGEMSDDTALVGRLVVAGSYGWLTVSGIDYGEMTDRDLGALGSIEMSGNGTRLRVDGQAIEVSPHNAIVARGNLKGRVGENGDRYISGSADAIWIGETRINATRWERLAVEWQIFAISSIGAVLAVLVALLRSTFARLKTDEPLYYYF